MRPILGDLHHGNNNLLILFLVMSMYYAWRKGWDIGAGLLLALATSYKVTPALFFVYFAYKRSWRTLTWGLLGLGIFLIIVPGAVIGPQFNGECLGMWWHRMITPFIVKNASSPPEINQSLVAVLTRLLTDLNTGPGRYDTHLDVNLVSLPAVGGHLSLQGRWPSAWWAPGVPLPDQNDRPPRPPPARRGLLDRADDAVSLRAELEAPLRDFAAPVQLSRGRILLKSPRPVAAGRSWSARGLLTFSLMAAASADLGGLFADGEGHEIAQGYGAFLWAGVLLYAMVAWRVLARRAEPDQSRSPESPGSSIHRTHFRSVAVSRPIVAS